MINKRRLIRAVAKNSSIILVVSLVTAVALSIPQIDVRSQSVGEGEPYVYYLPLAIYNNATTAIYNYTIEVSLTPDYVPAFNKLSVNPFVTNLSFAPYYYWVMRNTSSVFTIFIKVPYLPPKNYTFVLIWYGYRENIFPEYNDPYKVFYYFDDFDDTNNVRPFYSGAFSASTTPNYFTSNSELTMATQINAGSTDTEASVASTQTLPVTTNYIIGAGVKAVEGNDYPLFMYITYNYTINILWWTFNIPIWDLIGIYNDGSSASIVMGSYSNNIQQQAPAQLDHWYYFRLFVSPSNSYGSVEDFNNGSTVVGWTQLESNGYFSNQNVYFGFGQALTSGTDEEVNSIKFIYIRRIVFPQPIVYILPVHFYVSFRP